MFPASSRDPVHPPECPLDVFVASSSSPSSFSSSLDFFGDYLVDFLSKDDPHHALLASRPQPSPPSTTDGDIIEDAEDDEPIAKIAACISAAAAAEEEEEERPASRLSNEARSPAPSRRREVSRRTTKTDPERLARNRQTAKLSRERQKDRVKKMTEELAVARREVHELEYLRQRCFLLERDNVRMHAMLTSAGIAPPTR